MNAKLKTLIACLALLVIVSVPISLGLLHSAKERLENRELTTPSVSVDDIPSIPEHTTPIEIPPVSSATLSSLESVSPEEDPLLYDFLTGCLDWHISIHRDVLDSDLYILRNLKEPSVLYTDWYVTQGGFTVPPTGTGIETTVLQYRDIERYNTVVERIPEEYIVRDGDWELVIYAGDAATELNNLGVISRNFHHYAEGSVPPFIEDGSGWPTEWLRKEPYASHLASESEIDIQDVWWDTFRLSGRYDFIPNTPEASEFSYYAICTGVMEFSFCDNQGNVARGMSWDLLRTTCNTMQYNINGIYACGSWQPETE